MFKKIVSIVLLAAALFTVSCANNSSPSTEELRSITVASSDTVTVSAAAMSYFYNDIVLSFLNHYSAVLDKLELDPSIPLDEQMMKNRDNTWREYFLDSACAMTFQLAALNEAAKADGVTLSEAEVAAVTARAEKTKVGSYGANVDTEAIIEARLLEALAYKYMEMKEIELQPTVDEMNAYISENKKDFEYSETTTLNVRTIMLFTTSFESKEEALNKANELMEIIKNDPTPETFASISLEYSDDPSSSYVGGLYPNLAPKKSIDALDKWCFDEARAIGDIAVIESEYGYHVVYAESEGLPEWQAEISAEMVSKRYSDFSDTIHKEHFVTFEEGALTLIK